MGLFNLHSIRNRYLITLLLLCLLPISVITYLSNIAYKKYLLKNVGERLHFHALAPFNTIWRYTWVAFFIIIFITLGATLYLSKRLAGPIITLSEAAQAIASGDITKRIVADSSDEIGVLGNAFNLMSDAISKKIETINNMSMSTFLRSIITQSPFSTWVSDNKERGATFTVRLPIKSGVGTKES